MYIVSIFKKYYKQNDFVFYEWKINCMYVLHTKIKPLVKEHNIPGQ